jgi:hypothetical protein
MLHNGNNQGHDIVAINVRCIEEVNLDTLKVKHVDGPSL